MRTSFPVIIAILLAFAGQAVAQDVLLMTNGKYRDIKGKVVATEYDVVIWQTEKQAQKEAAYLEKHGKTRDEFVAEETARTATAKEKLAQKRKEMEAQILPKMESLSPEDFEKWKNEQMLKLAEAEAAIGGSKAKRKKRRFTSRVSRELVFSYISPDSTETVVYSADTLGFLADGDAEVDWGVDDMRKYIKGRQDGRKHGVYDIGIGAGVGLLSGLLNTWYLDVFYAPITPAVCIAIIAIINTRPNPKTALASNFLQSEPYLDGYERSAKGRKILMFTLGAVGGLGVGIGVAVVTSPALR
jgi:hypothetical protein